MLSYAVIYNRLSSTSQKFGGRIRGSVLEWVDEALAN